MSSKLIKCKTCGADIAKSANRCPNCGAKVKNTARTLTGILFLILGIILIIAAVGGSHSSETKAGTPIEKVTLENFGKINSSMTYEDVCQLFGKEGTLDSEVDIGDSEYITQIYHWYDNTGVANCTITFQGGYMIAKAQVGLK